MFFVILLFDVFILGWMGGLPAEEPFVMISQTATIYYFAHFLIILPLVSAIERQLPLPRSISERVLHGEKAEDAPLGDPPTSDELREGKAGVRPCRSWRSPEHQQKNKNH